MTAVAASGLPSYRGDNRDGYESAYQEHSTAITTIRK